MRAEGNAMTVAPSCSAPSPSMVASPPPLNTRSPAYAPIQECDGEVAEPPIRSSRHSVSGSSPPSKHYATPFRLPQHKPRGSDGVDGSISWSRCRPNSREKTSDVNLDASGTKRPCPNPSPSHGSGIFKSLFSTLTKRSPRSTDPSREEQWRLAAAELSQRLMKATSKRDEALLEASKLKHSMSELERKLNKLEIYCNDLKSRLEECTTSHSFPADRKDLFHPTSHTVESFVHAVSDARSSVRLLSRSLTAMMRQSGGKIHEQVSSLLRPHDGKISAAGKSTKSLVLYLEAVLNRAFYEDFESAGFQRGGSEEILDPAERHKACLASHASLRDLSWEEVLAKGTRQFSESFSAFCDRKMSEIVGSIGWDRAWPEPLLQAFFFAAKGVWLVHLLARAVHPGPQIFRVETGAAFEYAYMEDLMGDRVRRLVPEAVRVMVAPGFYAFNGIIKCKVLCRYNQHLINV